MNQINRTTIIETELAGLFQVSSVLSRSLDLHKTLCGVLEVLHETVGMQRGLVTLLDETSGELLVGAMYNENQKTEEIRYQPGEGLVGTILEQGETVVVKRLSDDSRFLGRLGVYDQQLPFIGVPIRIGDKDKVVGVLTAQPQSNVTMYLTEYARFMEMVANLVSQSVRLSWMVESERRDLANERDQLRRTVQGDYGFDNIVGHSAPMRKIFEQVRQVAKWNTTVLVRGESGTGKELIANAIHYNSPRANGPMIKLNCAALPDNLLESELFGHEKGAFTGALSKRKGRFEQADGGTLFLDEIGEISNAFQAKLLRVLQEGEFERVGGTQTIKVDVRIIAATNRDLESDVEAKKFREDLYYRLNVMPIFMPSLRERSEDIPDLARFLVSRLAKSQARELKITDSAIRLLMQHGWPGNVRELENCLERAAIMTATGNIDREAIFLTGLKDKLKFTSASSPTSQVDINDPELDEREKVIAALEQAGWVQAKAARLLSMTPRQIAYRIQTLKIKVRQI